MIKLRLINHLTQYSENLWRFSQTLTQFLLLFMVKCGACNWFKIWENLFLVIVKIRTTNPKGLRRLLVSAVGAAPASESSSDSEKTNFSQIFPSEKSSFPWEQPTTGSKAPKFEEPGLLNHLWVVPMFLSPAKLDPENLGEAGARVGPASVNHYVGL